MTTAEVRDGVRAAGTAGAGRAVAPGRRVGGAGRAGAHRVVVGAGVLGGSGETASKTAASRPSVVSEAQRPRRLAFFVLRRSSSLRMARNPSSRFSIRPLLGRWKDRSGGLRRERHGSRLTSAQAWRGSPELRWTSGTPRQGRPPSAARVSAGAGPNARSRRCRPRRDGPRPADARLAVDLRGARRRHGRHGAPRGPPCPVLGSACSSLRPFLAGVSEGIVPAPGAAHA